MFKYPSELTITKLQSWTRGKLNSSGLPSCKSKMRKDEMCTSTAIGNQELVKQNAAFKKETKSKYLQTLWVFVKYWRSMWLRCFDCSWSGSWNLQVIKSCIPLFWCFSNSYSIDSDSDFPWRNTYTNFHYDRLNGETVDRLQHYMLTSYSDVHSVRTFSIRNIYIYSNFHFSNGYICIFNHF